MKYCKLALLGAAILFVCAPAANAGPGDLRIGPKIGVAIPFGDLGDFADTGFLFGATGDYGLTDNIALGGNLLYNPYSVEDEGEIDFSFSIFHITANGKYYFESESNLGFFAAAGAGLYMGRTSLEGTTVVQGIEVSFDDSETETDLGIQFGGGLDVPVGESGIELAANIHIIFSEESSNLLTIEASVPFSVIAGE